MNSTLRKISLSLQVDITWIRTKGIPYKWRYLAKKYLFLIFPYLFWDKTSHTYALSLFGKKVYIPNKEHIAFLQGTYTDHAYLKKYIQPNAIVIDVGAHVGEFALVCATILHAKEVFSFEPVKRSYDLLEQNTPFRAYYGAIGTEKIQKIYVAENTVASSGFSNTKKEETELTPCISPDHISEIVSLDHIDLFKIDVEGMEYDVLMASKETLRKSLYIIVELSLHREATNKAVQTIELLHEIIPHVELIHIGSIFTKHHQTRQIAVDMLFYNSMHT